MELAHNPDIGIRVVCRMRERVTLTFLQKVFVIGFAGKGESENETLPHEGFESGCDVRPGGHKAVIANEGQQLVDGLA